jgi:hypothetical protein
VHALGHGPHVDDVADEIKLPAVDTVEQIQQLLGLAVHAAEVHVGNPKGMTAHGAVRAKRLHRDVS